MTNTRGKHSTSSRPEDALSSARLRCSSVETRFWHRKVGQRLLDELRHVEISPGERRAARHGPVHAHTCGARQSLFCLSSACPERPESCCLAVTACRVDRRDGTRWGVPQLLQTNQTEESDMPPQNPPSTCGQQKTARCK